MELSVKKKMLANERPNVPTRSKSEASLKNGVAESVHMELSVKK